MIKKTIKREPVFKETVEYEYCCRAMSTAMTLRRIGFDGKYFYVEDCKGSSLELAYCPFCGEKLNIEEHDIDTEEKGYEN